MENDFGQQDEDFHFESDEYDISDVENQMEHEYSDGDDLTKDLMLLSTEEERNAFIK